MKVTVKRWHGVATWQWGVDEECCGICRYAFEACCPDCTLPGDGCPPGTHVRLFRLPAMQCQVEPLASTASDVQTCDSLCVYVNVTNSVGRLQARFPHALPDEVARVAAVCAAALPHVPPGVEIPQRLIARACCNKSPTSHRMPAQSRCTQQDKRSYVPMLVYAVFLFYYSHTLNANPFAYAMGPHCAAEGGTFFAFSTYCP